MCEVVKCEIHMCEINSLITVIGLCLGHGSCMVNGSVDAVPRAWYKIRYSVNRTIKLGHFSIVMTKYIRKFVPRALSKMVSKTWFCPILSY